MLNIAQMRLIRFIENQENKSLLAVAHSDQPQHWRCHAMMQSEVVCTAI